VSSQSLVVVESELLDRASCTPGVLSVLLRVAESSVAPPNGRVYGDCGS